jgi:hypothetical protein
MEWVDSEGIRYYEHVTPEGDTIRHRDYFGGGMNRERGQRAAGVEKVLRDIPTAFITRRPPNNVIVPHFHELPQYQLFIEGSGRVGKHEMRPVTVHYADRFTPYGPIVASDEGLAFMTIRTQTSNGGAFRMPKSRPFMERKAGRAYSVHADIGPSSAAAGQVARREIIGPLDDGVEAALLSLGAGAKSRLELQRDCDRCLVVMAGHLLDGERPLGMYSCTFVSAGEVAPEVLAGPEGAQVLALGFPPALPTTGSSDAH